VEIPEQVSRLGIRITKQLGVDSLRAEITFFEAARAYAAADGRSEVNPDDLRVVAPMALRLRRSAFMTSYFEHQSNEDQEVARILNETIPVKEG
jgi:magnesium chelatase subunit I